MMWLKRVQNFNEALRCNVSNEFIVYGQFYYQDDEDDFIIKADVYYKLKRERELKENQWKLTEAQSQYEYELKLKDIERQLFLATLFERKIAGKDDV